MPSDLEIVHRATKQLQACLHKINNMIQSHLREQDPVPKSHKEKKPKHQKKNHSEQRKKLPAQDQKHQHKEQKQGDEQKLKRPLSAYFRFACEQRNLIKSQYPDLSVTAISEVTGDMWKKMTEQDKQVYVDDSKAQLQKFYQLHPEQKNKKRHKKPKKKQHKEEH